MINWDITRLFYTEKMNGFGRSRDNSFHIAYLTPFVYPEGVIFEPIFFSFIHLLGLK